jgi:hypothetical protein
MRIAVRYTTRLCSSSTRGTIGKSIPNSYNSPLPDGDVPDVSKEGFPIGAIVKPFLSKIFESEQSNPLPLGRWKVSSCDDVLDVNGNKPIAYDNCMTGNTESIEVDITQKFYNSKLPDGNIPDMSKAGLPLGTLVKPFLNKIFEKQNMQNQENVPLGRWKVNSCDDVLDDKRVTAYDHCTTTIEKTDGPSPAFFNSELPDGDVPDLQKVGFPLKDLVLPFLSKSLEKGKTAKDMPLGRWKVNSCDDVLDKKKATTHTYDHSS